LKKRVLLKDDKTSNMERELREEIDTK